MRSARLVREVALLRDEPPYGISVWPEDPDKLTQLNAEVQGPADTVYGSGVFRLTVDVPERYPLEPPKVRFVTPVYHPNIDSAGRICLDTLKMPPKGSWSPSVNISTLLTTIRLLLLEPNPGDALMADVAAQYVNDRAAFDRTAREWVSRHAAGSEAAATATATVTRAAPPLPSLPPSLSVEPSVKHAASVSDAAATRDAAVVESVVEAVDCDDDDDDDEADEVEAARQKRRRL